jgi:hypothetical protein
MQRAQEKVENAAAKRKSDRSSRSEREVNNTISELYNF